MQKSFFTTSKWVYNPITCTAVMCCCPLSLYADGVPALKCLQAAKKLGHLLTLTALKRLNVAFNELSSCDGIEQLQQLQSLNLSHNQLSSLDPVSALTGLTRWVCFSMFEWFTAPSQSATSTHA
jgi:hypothetical protein